MTMEYLQDTWQTRCFMTICATLVCVQVRVCVCGGITIWLGSTVCTITHNE